jgi:hypothetical protein
MKTKFKPMLTTINAKTIKGESLGYLTGIMYLAPSTIVNGVNLCPMASKGCKQACLYTAGRGRYQLTKTARIKKTELFRDNLEFFMQSLEWSISKVAKKAQNKGLKPAIRLNGTSDIRWENIRNSKGQNIFEMFPSIQFYDYTADHTRIKALTGNWSNYHLTFSRKESRANHLQAEKLLKLGVNVSAVYIDPEKVISTNPLAVNGDAHDLRFLDPKGEFSGRIIALRAKGEAKKDFSGFVIRNA